MHRGRAAQLWVLALGVALLLVACENGSTDEAKSPDGGDDQLCSLFQQWQDLNVASQSRANDFYLSIGGSQALNEPDATDERERYLALVRESRSERGPEIEQLYDEMEATLPSDLRADMETIRDYRETYLDALLSLEPTDSFSAVLEAAQPLASDYEVALLTLDSYSRQECDILLTIAL